MAMPTFTMRQLLEAGIHFGHQTRRWNPKMAPYIFGVRNDAHIIDLQQTMPLLHRATKVIRDIVAGGGRVLFVGTKRQAAEAIASSAKRCGQFYVNHRWLGGMLTNWKTISVSIRRLRVLEEQLQGEIAGLTKKEMLRLTRQRDKLERALGGIKEMGGLPDILFIIDTNKEAIAIAEATKLGIPVVAVIDSNSDPDVITYPIPGNDDAIRAINFFGRVVSDAVLDGIQEEMQAAGVDVGAAEEVPVEPLPSAEKATAEPSPSAEKAPAETPKVEGATVVVATDPAAADVLPSATTAPDDNTSAAADTTPATAPATTPATAPATTPATAPTDAPAAAPATAPAVEPDVSVPAASETDEKKEDRAVG